MKKIFRKIFFLPAVIIFSAVLFSCATSGNLADASADADSEKTAAESGGGTERNADDGTDGELVLNGEDDSASLLKENAAPEEGAVSEEERIPQSEVDELNSLLAAETPAAEKIEDELAGSFKEDDDSTNTAGNEIGGGNGGAFEGDAAPLAADNSSADNSSAAENGANGASAAENSANGSNAATAQNNAASQSGANTENAAANNAAGSNASMSAASNNSRNQGGSSNAANGSGGLNRVTSQGNSFGSGPLIGPGSDKSEADGENSRVSQGGGKSSSDISATYDFSEGGNNAARSNSPVNNIPADNIDNIIEETGSETEEAAEEKKELLLPSRSVTVKNNQFLDIEYPGSGWIYLGEVESPEQGYDKGHFIFQGRKLGKSDTTFTLRSRKGGKALLHFYKNDALTGKYIDDYIEVSVGDESASDAAHIHAPDYAELVPPKYDRNGGQGSDGSSKLAASDSSDSSSSSDSSGESGTSGTSGISKNSEAKSGGLSGNGGSSLPRSESEEPAEKIQTVIQTDAASSDSSANKNRTAVAGTDSATSGRQSGNSGTTQGSRSGGTQTNATSKASDLLEQAQKAYDEKRYADALNLVQQFFDVATEDFDAGLFLEGLILEAKSEVRNIKSAIDAYDTVIKNYPQSSFWRRANERSIYLKRFYIDIR